MGIATSRSLLRTSDTSRFTPRRWLITGGCGFIGRNLIQNIIKENPDAKITVLDNLSVGTKEELSKICTFAESDSAVRTSDSPTVTLVVGDIKDYSTCLRVTQNIDIIVHLAASTGVVPSVENPREDLQDNVIGTFNLLEASRENDVKRFIFASSGAPIGECKPPIHETLAPRPVSPYGASKLAGEAYCMAYFRTFGIETIILRFGNVYGPLSNQKNSVVATFIKQAIAGRPLEIHGDGNQTRDFIFIEDLLRAIRFSVAIKGLGGETFQIATSAETSIKELVDVLVQFLYGFGIKDVEVRYTPQRAGDVLRNFSDTSKAKRMLDWQAEVHLQKGLNRTIQWFIKREMFDNELGLKNIEKTYR